jgi:hypothetical protein
LGDQLPPESVITFDRNTQVKLTRMPLDLGYDTSRLLPALRLIAEAGVVTADLERWSPDWALEQVADPVLQDAIGRQPDCELDPENQTVG